jgi:hypothetical protein
MVGKGTAALEPVPVAERLCKNGPGICINIDDITKEVRGFCLSRSDIKAPSK